MLEEILGERNMELIPMGRSIVDGRQGLSVQKDAVFTNRRSKETLYEHEC